jgi:transporter family protein
MWLLFAFGSAAFAGVTAILAKIGIKNTDSNVATAIRTVVVLGFSWLLVLITGSHPTLSAIQPKPLLFLILSGFATGASWLCYFRALHLADVSKVTPIDKSSTVLTMLFAFLFLNEPVSWLNLFGMAAIGIGTYLMVEKKSVNVESTERKGWLMYAILSAVFASLTSILGKVGIQGIDSTLGTAIRTVVVVIMAWGIVFLQRKQSEVRRIDARSWRFICLSGISTGLSWLCYYRALQDGQASIVVPIDKLSILFTVAFAYLFLKERIKNRGILGLASITFGTLLLLI